MRKNYDVKNHTATDDLEPTPQASRFPVMFRIKIYREVFLQTPNDNKL